MGKFISVLSLLTLVQLFPSLVYSQTIPEQKIPEQETSEQETSEQETSEQETSEPKKSEYNNQSFDPIQKVVSANLMSKYPDGKFYPERFMSRAELASIMVKTFLLDKQKNASQEDINVTDVPSSHWAFKDIQTVLKTGVMKGYRGDLFFPNQKVTRAEALAIFAQSYGVFQFPEATVDEILAKFPDQKSIPKWARKAVATAVTGGFVNQKTDGKLAPLKPMTRGDMAYVLGRYLQRQQRHPYTPEVTPIKDTPAAPVAPI
ncbi:MAG: S-layer homology domain-containing protein [Calothrix sp. MO_167.B42]|nr:S-layer homology domain-containing protein [Calothrix sp. MO_167.B42]